MPNRFPIFFSHHSPMGDLLIIHFLEGMH
jgi:hypothetical protein